jgi:hypothetical protein
MMNAYMGAAQQRVRDTHTDLTTPLSAHKMLQSKDGASTNPVSGPRTSAPASTRRSAYSKRTKTAPAPAPGPQPSE